MTDWQPIETVELPPFVKENWFMDAFKCLGARSGYFMGQITYGYTERGKGRWKDARGYICTPEFWMPAPAPPPFDVDH